MNPETAAGKSLFGRLWAVSEYSQASMVIATVDRDIVAIEAEARATVLADAIQRVEGRMAAAQAFIDAHPTERKALELVNGAAIAAFTDCLRILRDLGDGAG